MFTGGLSVTLAQSSSYLCHPSFPHLYSLPLYPSPPHKILHFLPFWDSVIYSTRSQKRRGFKSWLHYLLPEKTGPLWYPSLSFFICKMDYHQSTYRQRNGCGKQKPMDVKAFYGLESAIHTWIIFPPLLWLFPLPLLVLFPLPIGFFILEHESENRFKVLNSQLLCDTNSTACFPGDFLTLHLTVARSLELGWALT